MTEDELVKIWQISPDQERINVEKSRLMVEVQRNVDLIEKKIKQRDIREITAIIICIPVFTIYAIIVPFLLSKIASVCIILWGMYVAYRLQLAKKNKPAALSETYISYL